MFKYTFFICIARLFVCFDRKICTRFAALNYLKKCYSSSLSIHHNQIPKTKNSFFFSLEILSIKMVRNTKAEKSAVKAEGAASSVAAPVPVVEASASVTAPKEKKASTPKEKKPKAEVVAAAAPLVPVKEEIVAAAATPEPIVAMEVSSESLLSEIEANLQKIGSVYLTLKNDAKSFRKCLAKEKKLAEKNSKVKKAKKTGDINKVRKPSGFTKPTRISDELAAFLGKPSGTEMSRIDAAKEVINYIKTNNLKDKTNGRIIHPDVVLARLLKTTDADNLHFFNLQSYMKPHFYKAEPVVAATA